MPAIENAYRDIGIAVTFVEVPAERGLIELTKGHFDGDVIRLNSVIDRYEKLIAIDAVSLKTQTLLLCQPTIPCHSKVLYDSTVTIAAPTASVYSLNNLLEGEVNATLMSIDKAESPLALLRKARVDYVVYPFLKNKVPKWVSDEMQSVELFVGSASHVIHERHKDLLPKLQSSLKNHLFTSSIDLNDSVENAVGQP